MCRDGRLSDGAVVFMRLIEDGSDDPLHLSYHGLFTATVRGNPIEGRRLCERALQFGAYDPQLVLNLVRLYEADRQIGKAVRLLRRGIRENPGNPKLLEQINRLSPRRRPPLSFVDRDNVVNKQMALLFDRLRNQIDKAAPARHRRADDKARARRA